MRAQYEQLGESIWSQMEASQMSISNSTGENVNFTGENLPPPVEEAAAHIANRESSLGAAARRSPELFFLLIQ